MSIALVAWEKAVRCQDEQRGEKKGEFKKLTLLLFDLNQAGESERWAGKQDMKI
jgi:hypothetical protein